METFRKFAKVTAQCLTLNANIMIMSRIATQIDYYCFDAKTPGKRGGLLVQYTQDEKYPQKCKDYY